MTDDIDPEDFHRRFLEANANPEYMARTLADFVRRMMRAALNRDGSQQYEAAQDLKHFLDLVPYSKDVRLHGLIEKASERLAVDVEWGSHEFERVNLARDATRYLLEMSCDDNAARGRASKRWDYVSRAIDDLHRKKR